MYTSHLFQSSSSSSPAGPFSLFPDGENGDDARRSKRNGVSSSIRWVTAREGPLLFVAGCTQESSQNGGAATSHGCTSYPFVDAPARKRSIGWFSMIFSRISTTMRLEQLLVRSTRRDSPRENRERRSTDFEFVATVLLDRRIRYHRLAISSPLSRSFAFTRSKSFLRSVGCPREATDCEMRIYIYIFLLRYISTITTDAAINFLFYRLRSSSPTLFSLCTPFERRNKLSRDA